MSNQSHKKPVHKTETVHHKAVHKPAMHSAREAKIVHESEKANEAKANEELETADANVVTEVEQPAQGQLRTDGPTLVEWVAAGYKEENYPPTGYAVREESTKPTGDKPELKKGQFIGMSGIFGPCGTSSAFMGKK